MILPAYMLHEAAANGSTERTVALLSRRSIDIDQRSPKGMTPLMTAAEKGFSRVARILLNRGANVAIAEKEGRTALHFRSIRAPRGHQ